MNWKMPLNIARYTLLGKVLFVILITGFCFVFFTWNGVSARLSNAVESLEPEEMDQTSLNIYYGNEARMAEERMQATIEEIKARWLGTNQLSLILAAQDHFTAMRKLELEASYGYSMGTVTGMCYSSMWVTLTDKRTEFLRDTWLQSAEIEGGGINVCQPTPYH